MFAGSDATINTGMMTFADFLDGPERSPTLDTDTILEMFNRAALVDAPVLTEALTGTVAKTAALGIVVKMA